jgi:hypothetical protein
MFVDYQLTEHFNCSCNSQSQVTRTAQNALFIQSILPKKGPSAYEKFIEALAKHGQKFIAKQLDPQLTENFVAAGNGCIVIYLFSACYLLSFKSKKRHYLIYTHANYSKSTLD